MPGPGILAEYPVVRERKFTVLVKVFPIKLKDGMQDKAEAVVHGIEDFLPNGPWCVSSGHAVCPRYRLLFVCRARTSEGGQ